MTVAVSKWGICALKTSRHDANFVIIGSTGSQVLVSSIIEMEMSF